MAQTPTHQTVTITIVLPNEPGEEQRLITPAHLMLGQSPDNADLGITWLLVAFDHARKTQAHFPMQHIVRWEVGDTREVAPDVE